MKIDIDTKKNAPNVTYVRVQKWYSIIYIITILYDKIVDHRILKYNIYDRDGDYESEKISIKLTHPTNDNLDTTVNFISETKTESRILGGIITGEINEEWCDGGAIKMFIIKEDKRNLPIIVDKDKTGYLVKGKDGK